MWQIMYDEDNPEEIREVELRDILKDNYMEVDLIIDASKTRPNMWFKTSPFSHFRWIEEKGENNG